EIDRQVVQPPPEGRLQRGPLVAGSDARALQEDPEVLVLLEKAPQEADLLQDLGDATRLDGRLEEGPGIGHGQRLDLQAVFASRKRRMDSSMISWWSSGRSAFRITLEA